MGQIETKKDLMNYLTERVRDYAPDCQASILRNSHMNELEKNCFTANLKEIEAILVDFINYIGTHQGLDWGLYTHYLHERNKQC